MKKRNEIFDTLENANDNMIEMMSETYPATDKPSRARMFAMSERKYNDMKRNNAGAADFENEVEGVERYRRPKWYRTLYTTAACLVAVIGIAGSAMIIRNLSDGDDEDITVPPVISENHANIQEGTQTGTSIYEEYVNTTAASAYAAEVSGTDISEVNDETATDTTTTSAVQSASQVKTNDAVVESTVTETAESEEPLTESNTQYSFIGFWTSSENGDDIEKIYRFYDDSTGGNFISTYSGMGLGFGFEINGNNAVFHMATVENNTNAVVTWTDNDHFKLLREDSSEENFTRITEDEYNTIEALISEYNFVSGTSVTDTSEYEEIAAQQFDNWCTFVQLIEYSNEENVDMNDTFTITSLEHLLTGETTNRISFYARYTDSRFKSTADIRKFIESCMTDADSYIEAYIPDIDITPGCKVETVSPPMFCDYDGKLYYNVDYIDNRSYNIPERITDKPIIIAVDSDDYFRADIVIKSIDDGFYAMKDEKYPEYYVLEFRFKKENGVWKKDGFYEISYEQYQTLLLKRSYMERIYGNH